MFNIKRTYARIPQRWIHTIMATLGWALAYSMSICLSIAITEMVKPVDVTEEVSADTCPTEIIDGPTVNRTADSEDLFDWDRNTQGIILSSYFWGSLISQLIGSTVSNKIGAKYTVGYGVLISAIITLLTPVAITWGDYPVLIPLRVFLGISSTIALPANVEILAEWVPKEEKSLHTSIVLNGSGIGAVIAMLLSGPLLRYYRWPVVLYLFGIPGIVWFIFWMILCYDSPRVHPFISTEEANYLRENLKDHKHENLPPFPWRHVLRSSAVWALLIIQCGYGWCTILVDSDLPSYSHTVLQLQIDSTGYLNSLPHLTSVVFSIISAWLADWMITKKNISTTIVRKLFACVAIIIPAIFFLGASYAGCNQQLAVGLMIIAITMTGSIFPSMKVNALDLSPNYAGNLSSMTLAVGMVFYILCPYVTGILTPNHTVGEWRLVFWILFGILLLTGVIFLVFAKGDVQVWNDPEFHRKINIGKEHTNRPLSNGNCNGSFSLKNPAYMLK